MLPKAVLLKKKRVVNGNSNSRETLRQNCRHNKQYSNVQWYDGKRRRVNNTGDSLGRQAVHERKPLKIDFILLCVENATNRLFAHFAQPFAYFAVKPFLTAKNAKDTGTQKIFVLLEVPRRRYTQPGKTNLGRNGGCSTRAMDGRGSGWERSM